MTMRNLRGLLPSFGHFFVLSCPGGFCHASGTFSFCLAQGAFATLRALFRSVLPRGLLPRFGHFFVLSCPGGFCHASGTFVLPRGLLPRFGHFFVLSCPGGFCHASGTFSFCLAQGAFATLRALFRSVLPRGLLPRFVHKSFCLAQGAFATLRALFRSVFQGAFATLPALFRSVLPRRLLPRFGHFFVLSCPGGFCHASGTFSFCLAKGAFATLQALFRSVLPSTLLPCFGHFFVLSCPGGFCHASGTFSFCLAQRAFATLGWFACADQIWGDVFRCLWGTHGGWKVRFGGGTRLGRYLPYHLISFHMWYLSSKKSLGIITAGQIQRNYFFNNNADTQYFMHFSAFFAYLLFLQGSSAITISFQQDSSVDWRGWQVVLLGRKSYFNTVWVMVLYSPWFVLTHPGDVQEEGRKASTNKYLEDWPGRGGKQRAKEKSKRWLKFTPSGNLPYTVNIDNIVLRIELGEILMFLAWCMLPLMHCWCYCC